MSTTTSHHQSSRLTTRQQVKYTALPRSIRSTSRSSTNSQSRHKATSSHLSSQRGSYHKQQQPHPQRTQESYLPTPSHTQTPSPPQPNGQTDGIAAYQSVLLSLAAQVSSRTADLTPASEIGKDSRWHVNVGAYSDEEDERAWGGRIWERNGTRERMRIEDGEVMDVVQSIEFDEDPVIAHTSRASRTGGENPRVKRPRKERVS